MKHQVRETVLHGLDQRSSRLAAAREAAAKPARGWLRATRTALGLSQGDVATRLSLTQQAYAEFEAAEERGAISLNSLQRAADAMQCELVYFVVPRADVAETFSELARRTDPAAKHLAASEHSMGLENQAVGDLPRKRKTKR